MVGCCGCLAAPADFGAVWSVVVPVALGVASGGVAGGFPVVVVGAHGASVAAAGWAGVGPGEHMVCFALGCDDTAAGAYAPS